MKTLNLSQKKKERFFARGLGKMEIAASAYTKEFFEAQRVFNEKSKKRQNEIKGKHIILAPSELAPKSAAPAKVYKVRRAFLIVTLLLAVLSLTVIVLGGLLPRYFALFIKPGEQKYISAWDPVFGGMIKFFRADFSSHFYNDCLRYADNAHLLTAISFYILPIIVPLSAALSLITAIFLFVALMKNRFNEKGVTNIKPPISGLLYLQILLIIAVSLSGILWNSSGEFFSFLQGGYLVAGGGLWILIASAFAAVFALSLSYKKLNKR